MYYNYIRKGEEMNYADPVELRKIRTAEGLEVTKKRAVVNVETNQVIGVVSPRYKLIHNTELLNVIRPVLEELKINSEPSINMTCGGAVTFFKFLGDKISEEVKKGDIVRFGVEFFNSYDGSMPVGFHIIAERLVCTNGLVAPKSITEISIRHTSSASTAEIRNRLQDFFPKVTSTVKMWQLWADYHPDEAHIERFITRAPIGMKLGRELLNRYQNLEPNQQTLWEFYNILTYYITHQIKVRKEELRGARQFHMNESLTNRLANAFEGAS